MGTYAGRAGSRATQHRLGTNAEHELVAGVGALAAARGPANSKRVAVVAQTQPASVRRRPATPAGKTFITGLPTNWATNRLAGSPVDLRRRARPAAARPRS